jgi:hypothetical protein
MISDVPYPNIKGWLVVPTGVVLLIASIPLIWHLLLRNIIDIPATEIEYIAVIFMLAYLVLGPFMVLRKRGERRKKRKR